VDGETRFLGESIKWISLLVKNAATPSSVLYIDIDCVFLVGGRINLPDVRFIKFPRTLSVESDPMFATGAMMAAFAKDTNDRAVTIFVKTEANMMIDSYWIDSL